MAPTEGPEEAVPLTTEQTSETFSEKACSKERAPIRRARVQTLFTRRDPTTIEETVTVPTAEVIGLTVAMAIAPTEAVMTAPTAETRVETTEVQPGEATRIIVDASPPDLAPDGRRLPLRKAIAPSRRR